MTKYLNKKPKFKIGDIVVNIREEGTVTLVSRWDDSRTSAVSWLVQSIEFPNTDPFALLEGDMLKVG